MRVATEHNPLNSSTATVGVWIDSGSRFEDDHNNGCSHFLEHLAFKGTKRRPRVSMEKEVENLGGHLNAYTSREQTTYFASVMKKDIPQAVDLLEDIVFHSEMKQESIDAERSTILEEKKNVYEDREEYVFDKLHDAAFLNQPLGFDIIGSTDNVNRITRQMLLDYVRAHYTPERMVLVGTGAVDHARLVKLAEEKFGKVPRGDPARKPEALAAKFVGGEYREREDDMQLAHIALSYETCGWRDPDTFPLDTGLFGVYATVYETRLMEMTNCILRAFSDLSMAVTGDQVEEVRNSLITAAFSSCESTSQAYDEIGRQVLNYGRKIPAAEFMARLNEVTAKDVRRVANRFLYDKDHCLAAVGPIFEMPPIEWIRKRNFSIYR